MIKNIERSRDGMDSLIDRAREAVVGAADRTERGVESVAKRVVKQTHLAGEHVRGGAEEASRGAHRRVKSAARALDRGYSRAHDDLLRARRATSDYVTGNPGRTLLLAATAGFLVGVVVRRRHLSV